MKIEKDKNRKKLLLFCGYCATHPEERFWQALRNWNQIENPKHNFIITAEIDPKGNKNWIKEEDTFYKE